MEGIRIPVCDVAASTEPYVAVHASKSIRSVLLRSLIAHDLSCAGSLVCCSDANGFVHAAKAAFFDHLPLVISPDDIWFCIAQGFANHVNTNAESLRHHFVSHAGKRKLCVTRPDFTAGPDDPWPEVFTAFSDQVAKQVGAELRDAIVADFTTTTPTQRAATEVLLMDAFQAYFEYEFRAGCGIPWIRLRGAPDDWRNVRRRAEHLRRFGLESWIDVLLPVLDKIEASSRGHVDAEFWKSFFRYDSGSGGEAITGWLQTLFPYIKRMDEDRNAHLAPNPYFQDWWKHYEEMRSDKDWRDKSYSGPTLLDIPSGLASAPVTLQHLGNGSESDIRFVAGMFGVAQDASSLELSPAWGWAVVHDQHNPSLFDRSQPSEPQTARDLDRWRRVQEQRRKYGLID